MPSGFIPPSARNPHDKSEIEYLGLKPEELEVIKTAVERRLYSMAKCGIRKIKDVFSLPTDSFYCQYHAEVVLLQSAGEKLDRFSLNL